jgi:hypothetical protein
VGTAIGESWFSVDTTGTWRNIVTKELQSGAHFHLDPFPGSKELMKWHLPQEAKAWINNFKTIWRR